MSDRVAGSGAEPPLTTRFQVLFGPDGLCRIALLADTDAEDRTIAILDLNAADGDLLARLLTTRRETHEQARRDRQAGLEQ